jgi:chromosome segregation ATPase
MNETEDRVVPARQPMDYAEAERRMQDMAQRIRSAERDYDRAIEEAADAEAIYRKSLAERFRALREGGAAVEAAMTQARGECFNLSRERDIAVGRVRKTLEALEDRRGDRASLHKLVDWSGGIDVIERRNPRVNGSAPYASDD